MNALTIEELKALKRDDWVWLESISDECTLAWDKAYYVICERDPDDPSVFEAIGGVTTRNRCYLYFEEYGKTWLAYKNKEQSEKDGKKNMTKFIEVTEIGGSKVLLCIGKILSVLQEKDGTFIETGANDKGVSIGVMVRESYAEIKQKLCEV